MGLHHYFRVSNVTTGLGCEELLGGIFLTQVAS